MNRRGFIQISSVALLPILLGLFPRGKEDEEGYTIQVSSNRSFGHKIREASQLSPSSFSKTDIVIVGGGIAGVAAAMRLDGQNFRLFEGGKTLGGSSASDHWKTTEFATGAHYELAYPDYYGKEVIEELLKMNIIFFNTETNLYEFTDKQYAIKPAKAEQCFKNGEVYEEVLDGVNEIEAFNEIMHGFVGEMPLPTRLITEQYHYLNKVSFVDFLAEQMNLTPELKQRIDYQMLDDWGAKSDVVSALAGVHYYTCRPYYEQEVQLFSPPNGNAYFIQKMIGQLSQVESIHTRTMVRSVKEGDEGVEVEVYHEDGTIEQITAKGVIYAGQKHALPYIFPEATPLFNNEYAPWVVLNLVCRKGVNFGKWQNDVLTDKLEFLGFVASNHQKSRSEEYDVFTAYYCFDQSDREYLVEIENNPEGFVAGTIDLIETETKTSFKHLVKHVNVKIMGHAMPIPKPNYLTLKEVPEWSSRVVFAGVDTGRLPLFLEAFDSGLQAADRIMNNLNNKTEQGES